MKRVAFFVVSSLLAFSCTQDENLVVQTEKSESGAQMVLQASSGENVSISDVAVISENFWKERRTGVAMRTMANAVKSIQEIHPILNEEGTDTTAFVVNYANNAGFIIVGGTRNYYPILAYADEGFFATDEDEQPGGVKMMLAEYEYAMNEQSKTDTVSYLSYWNSLEKRSIQNGAQLMAMLPADAPKAGSEYFQWVESLIGDWKEQGYNVYNVTTNPGLPAATYQQWKNIAIDRTSGNSNQLALKGFILEKRVTNNEEVGSLVKTEWGQWSPYNRNLTMIGTQYPPAGCVAVAMAQIMKYHQWPTSYNWSAMSNRESLSTNWTHVAKLMKDIGAAVNMQYSMEGSGAYDSDAKNAFINKFGYSSNIKIVDHNFYTVKNELKANRPTYMSGLMWSDKENDYIGHAWVCDGYRYVSSTTQYTLIVIPSDTGYFWEQEGSYQSPLNISEYTHLNWGYSGENDAWYLDDNIKFMMDDEEWDYKYSRKDMINIYPNK